VVLQPEFTGIIALINDEIEREIKEIYGDNTIINIHTEPEF